MGNMVAQSVEGLADAGDAQAEDAPTTIEQPDANPFGSICAAIGFAAERAPRAAAAPAKREKQLHARRRELGVLLVAELMITARQRLPSESPLGAFAGATAADAALATEAVLSATSRGVPWDAIEAAAQEEGYRHPLGALRHLARNTGSIFPKSHLRALERGDAEPWLPNQPGWGARRARELFAGCDFGARSIEHHAHCNRQIGQARAEGVGWPELRAVMSEQGYEPSVTALSRSFQRHGTAFGPKWRECCRRREIEKRLLEREARRAEAASTPERAARAAKAARSERTPPTRRDHERARQELGGGVAGHAALFRDLGLETMTDEQMRRGWGPASDLGRIALDAIARGAPVALMRAAATLAGFQGSGTDFQHLLTGARRRGEIAKRKALIESTLAQEKRQLDAVRVEETRFEAPDAAAGAGASDEPAAAGASADVPAKEANPPERAGLVAEAGQPAAPLGRAGDASPAGDRSAPAAPLWRWGGAQPRPWRLDGRN